MHAAADDLIIAQKKTKYSAGQLYAMRDAECLPLINSYIERGGQLREVLYGNVWQTHSSQFEPLSIPPIICRI